MATNTFGTNRRRPPFQFGKPEPNLGEAAYEGLFEPTTDIQNIRTASVLTPPPVADTGPVYETAASERFKQLLEQFPERGNPGFMDKLAGAAAYVGNKQRNIPGGQVAADNAKYAGYNRNVADWAAKIEPAQAAASQENTRNVNSRNLEAIASRERQAQAKIESNEKINAEKIRVSEEKTKLVSEANRYKRLGWKIMEGGGGRIVAVNVEGERRDLGPSRLMDQIDLEELRNEGRIEAARVTGENAANRQVAGGWDYYEDASGNTWRKNTVTGEEQKLDPSKGGPVRKIGTGTPRADNETNQLEKDRVRNEKMRGLYELGTKYIKTRDRGKTFILDPRPVITDKWFGTDITQEDVNEWDRIKKELDPSYNPPTSSSTMPTNKPTSTPATQSAKPTVGANGVPSNAWVQESASTGRKRYSIDGGKTWKPYPGSK